MNTYLTIMVTALAFTQIMRVIQNFVQLRRQRIVFEKQLKELADMELTERDFETQRKAYRLLVEYLEHRVQFNEVAEEIDFDFAAEDDL